MSKDKDDSLKIKVLLIPEEETFKEWRLVPELFSGDNHPLPVKGPVLVQGKLYRIGETVHFNGNCGCVLSQKCSRCLKEYEFSINTDVTAVFMHGQPKFQTGQQGGQTELGEGDFGEQYYEGDVIDLYEPVRDQLALAAPMRPLCDESCKGLCPVCGASRNATECGCEIPEGDPRLAALKKLRFD